MGRLREGHVGALSVHGLLFNGSDLQFKVGDRDLQVLAEKTGLKAVTLEDLQKNGLVGKRDLVKILGQGELKAKLTVSAHAFSASAQAAIEAAGGKVEVLGKKAEEAAEPAPSKKAAPKAKTEAAPKAEEKAPEAPAADTEETPAE